MSDVLRLITEAQLQKTIEDMLDLVQAPHFHDVDARRDRRGFPDLVFPLAPHGGPHHQILHLWELKTEQGKLRPEQLTWANALLSCRSVDYRVIRPHQLDMVRAYILREREEEP